MLLEFDQNYSNVNDPPNKLDRMDDKNDTNKDSGARRLAWTGLILAALSIVIPFVQKELDDREDLIVLMQPVSKGTLLTSETSKVYSLIYIPWQITISNAGNVDLSVIELDFRDNKDRGAYRIEPFDMRHSVGSEVTLPLVLGSGESSIIKVYFVFQSSQRVHEYISQRTPKNSNGRIFTLNEIRNGLSDQGISLYEMGYFEHNARKNTPPNYEVRITTGRGNKFVANASDEAAHFFDAIAKQVRKEKE